MSLRNSVSLFLLSWFLLAQNASAEKRSSYIVHMDKLSMPKAFSNHHFWYSSILKSSVSQTSVDSSKPDPKLIYTYDHAFHGFSAMLSKDELKALKSSQGFVSAYPDHPVTPDTTRSTEFLSLNSASGLWPASQYGKDVIIGIIDTGIWPESPSFSEKGMTEIPARWKGICQEGEEFNSSSCNRKIIGARYFNQGARAENPDFQFSPNSARDDDGHGSHVSSIAAGNYVDGVSFFGYAPGTARGVAPRARIAVYKVLWRGGGVSSDMLAGIDQAVADGVHILSLSLGLGGNNLYENALAIASFGAREKGILVSFSAGNRGPSVRSIREKGIPWAVIVASGTLDRWLAGTITLGNGKTITGWTAFPASAVIRNTPLFYNQTLSACSSTDLAQAYDNRVMIMVCNITSQDIFAFRSLMTTLSESFIQAAIIIADFYSINRANSFPFPGSVISPAEAQELINYVSSTSEPTASIDFQQTILGTEPRAAPALSDDSSRGPARSYERILKPDLMAPGVSILAAYNPEIAISGGQPNIGRNIFLSSDYNILSGTSMACPHISGTAALLKAAHPEWSPSAIQSAMMTTANPLDNTNQPIKDTAFDYQVATPLGIGSGIVDPNRAIDPGLIYDASAQDFVNLVCSMNFTQEQTRAIIRSNYNCTNPSSDLNYPSFVALISAAEIGRTLTRRFQRTVTNVGEGAATYKVRLEVPLNTTIRVQPQTLVFRKKNEKQSYSLTIRYKGDIQIQHRPGSIIWIDQSGKYRVRSPIMVSAAADNFE
ncbi:hypothetical protein ACS0TY_023574 [Phlomoides rotata]